MDIEALVKRVIEALREQEARKHQLLILVNENNEGLDTILKLIPQLKKQGTEIKFLVSPHLHTQWHQIAPGEEAHCQPLDQDRRALVDGVSLIIGAALEFSSLARVSMGLQETPIERAMADTFLSGKKLLLPIEGILPSISEGTSQAYMKMICTHLRSMVSFGARLLYYRQLPHAVMEELKAQSDILYLEKPLVKEADMACVKPGGTISIAPGSTLSHGAREAARRAKIKVYKRLV